jgi:hypothetical protein
VADVGVVPGVRRAPVTVGERADLHAFGDDQVVGVDVLRRDPRRVDDEMLINTLGIHAILAQPVDRVRDLVARNASER